MRATAQKRQNLWLDAFVKTGTILGACRRTGVGRETVRQWRLKDPAFEARFQDSDLDITETLETKGMSQAMSGDTTLLIFFLKARRPKVYRDNIKVEHGGSVTVKDLILQDDPPPDPKRKKS